jgi:hypothetical protein
MRRAAAARPELAGVEFGAATTAQAATAAQAQRPVPNVASCVLPSASTAGAGESSDDRLGAVSVRNCRSSSGLAAR